MSSVTVVRSLAAICVLLALACALLAWRSERSRQTALCWRELAEEGVTAEGRCPAP